MITWIKPSGLEIETGENEATIKMAESLGWERAEQSEIEFDWGKSAKDGDSSASN